MENKSLLVVILILCGTLCILAAVGAAVLGTYFEYAARMDVPPPGVAFRFRVPDFAITLMFMTGLAGLGFVVAGVVVGVRAGRQKPVP